MRQYPPDDFRVFDAGDDPHLAPAAIALLDVDAKHPLVRRSARVALVGYTVARDLWGDEPPVGQRLFINRVPFEVAGVLAERGQGLDATNEDQQVYVPLTTAMRRLLNIDYYGSMLFEVAGSDDMERVSAEMEELLRVRHRISAFRPHDFRVSNQRELIETQLSSANRLGFLVRWIGLSGLAVAGLGVLAIAWIAVRDRTTEIGTRRVLGATAPDVFFQFAFEAMVLATIGAALGLAVGWAASRFTAHQAALPFVFERGNALAALGMAFVLNLVFASWPALRAAPRRRKLRRLGFSCGSGLWERLQSRSDSRQACRRPDSAADLSFHAFRPDSPLVTDHPAFAVSADGVAATGSQATGRPLARALRAPPPRSDSSL